MVKIAKPSAFKDTRQLPSKSIMEEIGRTAIVSASIEDIMHALHWKFAGLNDAVGSILTGDARATRLSEDIIRVAKAADIDADIVTDLKDIFSDFVKLAQERNEYVHWIWSWNTKTHEDRIDPPSYKINRQGRYVKTEDVAKLADELVWVEHRLMAHLMTESQLKASVKKYGSAGAVDAPTPWLKKQSSSEPS